MFREMNSDTLDLRGERREPTCRGRCMGTAAAVEYPTCRMQGEGAAVAVSLREGEATVSLAVGRP
jgi:hypothetical protein